MLGATDSCAGKSVGAHRSMRALADRANGQLGWFRKDLPSMGMAESGLIGVGSGVGERILGREKDEREEGEKEKKKGEEREKESFRFVRVFETQFYTPFGFPKMKFHFRIFLIVFTIFNKYGTKMNFRVKTLN